MFMHVLKVIIIRIEVIVFDDSYLFAHSRLCHCATIRHNSRRAKDFANVKNSELKQYLRYQFDNDDDNDDKKRGRII